MLRRIQAIVEATVPSAARCIGYNIPAYRLQRNFLYFAAFKRHVGIYPPVTDDPVLIGDLQPFRIGKGNLAFPLSAPMPYELIARVAASLAKQYSRPQGFRSASLRPCRGRP